MEQLGFQVNLAIGDGNNVGGDIGGDVAGLGFNDGQSRQRAAAVFRRQPRSALQQAGMEIEHVAGECFTPGGTANQQGNGTVGHSVLTQVVIDDQHVLALVHEIFAHGTASIGGDILQRRHFRSCGGNDNGIVHGAGFLQGFHQLGHGGAFLTNGDINADHVFALLVDNGIRCDGGFAGLAVADDQFTLAAADGDHGVDCLDAGLQRNRDVFALNNTGRRCFNGHVFDCFDLALAVNGSAQSVHHAADQSFAHRDGNHTAGALDGVALTNAGVRAQQNDGDRIFLQVLGHAVLAVGELHQLIDHALLQTRSPGDAVAHQNDGAGFALLDLVFIVLDLRLDDFRNFFRS